MSPIEPAAPRADRGAELLSALVVTISTGTLGVLMGLAWYLLAPTLPGKKVQGGLAYTSPYPEEQVAQDGWFTILGLIFGVLAAVLAWTLIKKWRGPIQMFAVTIGAIAAGYLAGAVGSQIGLDDYRERVAAAPIGAIVQKPVELSSAGTDTCVLGRCVHVKGGVLLVPSLGAAIAYALLAGWSRWPSLRREEEEGELSSAQELAPAGPVWPEQRESH